MAPRTIKLNDGHQIPWIGFGTGTALFRKDATQLVVQAIDNGINHLDGAQVYRNEDTLGLAIKESGKPRSELFVTTKLNPGETVNIKGTLEESLRKLQLDHVDLFLVHSPHPANKEGKLQDVWRQMEEVQAAGLATSIGVSNFRVEDLEQILQTAKVVPAVNQIELHPYVWDTARSIVEFGNEHGILTASYGGLTPIVRAPGGPVDPVIASIRERLENSRGTGFGGSGAHQMAAAEGHYRHHNYFESGANQRIPGCGESAGPGGEGDTRHRQCWVEETCSSFHARCLWRDQMITAIEKK